MPVVQSGVYSFLDVQVSMAGPGGNIDIASAGLADEGVKIAMVRDKNTMTMGAAGDGMHSLNASTAARITVTLLKTATGNALLNNLYRHQSTTSAYWGQNTLTITNPVSGDVITATGGAFVKQTDIGYSAEGGMNSWAFDFIATSQILGDSYQTTAGQV